MIRRDDVVTAAWRALDRSAAAAGLGLRLLDARATPWWSATFAGARLALVAAVVGGGDPLERWLAALPEAELPLPDRFVADCVVDARAGGDGGTELLLQLLVLDD